MTYNFPFIFVCYINIFSKYSWYLVFLLKHTLTALYSRKPKNSYKRTNFSFFKLYHLDKISAKSWVSNKTKQKVFLEFK